MATIYNDIGTNGQFLTVDHNLKVTRVEILAAARSWPEERARAKGSDVVLMVLDDTFATLGWGLLPRGEVPTEKDVWAGVDLNQTVELEAGHTYVLRVVEVSRGGEYGWNNYAYTEGNPYPGGGLTDRFSNREDLDLAFRLVGSR